MNANITVGKVAKGADVGIQTVRYYERRGLIAAKEHTPSGSRLYPLETVGRILFIKNAQELGFTLKEIFGLLRLRVSHRARCGPVKRRAQAKLADVQVRIAGLRAIERVLKSLVKACDRQTTTDDCPILKSLGNEKEEGE